jgi:EpsI family protein
MILELKKCLSLPSQRVQKEMRSLKIDLKGVSQKVKTAYANPPQLVQLYIGYYATESQDAELINQDNHFHDIRQRIEVQRNERTVILTNQTLSLNEKVLCADEQERILWYWYILNDFMTSNIYIGILVQAWQRLTGSAHGGEVVALLIEVGYERQEARERLHDFAKAMYPAIQSSLSEIRRVY